MSERRTAASLFSHIFKTPLASIQAASEILLKHLKDNLNQKDQQLLEVIVRNGKTLDMRVTKLLEAMENGDSVITEEALQIALDRDQIEVIHSLNWERPVETPPAASSEIALAEILGIEELQKQQSPTVETDSGQPDDRIVVHADPEIADLIPRFLENRQKDIVSIMEALHKKDYEAVKVFGHCMKGAGGGYGFPGLTEIGKSIEEAAKGQDSEGILVALDKLTNYLDRVEVLYD